MVKETENRESHYGLTLQAATTATEFFGIDIKSCKSTFLSKKFMCLNQISKIFWCGLVFYRFFVDKYPIRVFKNKHNIGVDFPSQPMNIMCSIWNGDSWATDGGQTKINWTYAPFTAGFRSFSIYGCPTENSMGPCSSTKYWWNRNQFWQLDPSQEQAYQTVKRKYLIYDYCTDHKRFPTPPPECPQWKLPDLSCHNSRNFTITV